MDYQYIDSQSLLAQFCDQLAGADKISLDTEFVSERSYLPELCLVQVASSDQLALIDALAVKDMKPFWNILAKPDCETIVHAGREEIKFSLRAIGCPPAEVFDVQLAAGLCGCEHPAGYNTLVFKLLGEKSDKDVTRTDWSRRPLSTRQIDYAIRDVVHLEPMRNLLCKKLKKLDRLEWMKSETTAWLDRLDDTENLERWRKTSGSSRLSARQLAIVRELWRWREKEAERRNCPMRRVLRDDLIVELARRGSSEEKQISAIRGMDRRDLKNVHPNIARSIRKAMDLPEDELPTSEHGRRIPSQVKVLGQFLSPALSSICRSAQIAISLVGTTSDVRELIAYRLGFGNGEPPALAKGWRAEVVGKLIDELITGKRSIRVKDPHSPEPLAFDSVEQKKGPAQ